MEILTISRHIIQTQQYHWNGRYMSYSEDSETEITAIGMVFDRIQDSL